MSDDPVRLEKVTDDESDVMKALQRDLAVSREDAGGDYDVDRGIERFRGLVATGGAALDRTDDDGGDTEGSDAEGSDAEGSDADRSDAGEAADAGDVASADAPGEALPDPFDAAASAPTGASGAATGAASVAAGVGAKLVGQGMWIIAGLSVVGTVIIATGVAGPGGKIEAPPGLVASEPNLGVEGEGRPADDRSVPPVGAPRPGPQLLIPAPPGMVVPPHANPSGPAPSAGSDALAAEMAHLAELRTAAHGDPARVLKLAEEGQVKFKGGTFGQEREAAAIIALARLGRMDESRVRAKAFLAKSPESPFAESIRKATGLPAK